MKFQFCLQGRVNSKDISAITQYTYVPAYFRLEPNCLYLYMFYLLTYQPIQYPLSVQLPCQLHLPGFFPTKLSFVCGW